MHPKSKGTIGELAVAKRLYEMGFAVFSEMGDNCKVDLIALRKAEMLRIQVKAHSSDDGRIHLDRRSNGPGYTYLYTSDDIDYFAVYVLDRDLVFFVDVAEFGDARRMTFVVDDGPALASQRVYGDYMMI